MKKMLASLSVFLMITGCASTKQYVPAASMNSLKGGNALIHVERKDEFTGSGRSVVVTDDGKKMGSLSTGHAITWQRPAGLMKINLAPAALAVKDLPPLKVNVVPGREYDFVVFFSWSDSSMVIKPK